MPAVGEWPWPGFDRVVVFANNRRQFEQWARRRGLSPRRREFTVVTRPCHLVGLVGSPTTLVVELDMWLAYHYDDIEHAKYRAHALVTCDGATRLEKP